MVTSEAGSIITISIFGNMVLLGLTHSCWEGQEAMFHTFQRYDTHSAQ